MTSQILQNDLAAALEPAQLMERLGLIPDDWQAALLEPGIKRALVLCARQVGKSTTSAIVAVHSALYLAPALILLLSPSLRQSSELFRKCAAFMRILTHGTANRDILFESALRLELRNGSRIVSLPGSDATVRGYSAANLIIVDECARCPDELVASIRPCLAVSDGRLIMMSTPAGRRGHFYEAWTFGGELWTRFSITGDQCPRIKPAFLQEELKVLGPQLYAQEYECKFLDIETSAFSSELINQAASDAAVSYPALWAMRGLNANGSD